MAWRVRDPSARRPAAQESEPAGPGPVERSSPALAALFESLKKDGRHCVLDLGPGGGQHLRLLGPFARQVRFAGLLPEPSRGSELAAELARLPPNPGKPYDVVLAWDALDRLRATERAALIARLAELVAPGARLYAFVDGSGAATVTPVRTTLVGLDRISLEPIGRAEPSGGPLLPAAVERALAPFEVVHAFSLRIGTREYVAMKR